MFGSIGNFKAIDNKFSNHTGNQYNTDTSLPSKPSLIDLSNSKVFIGTCPFFHCIAGEIVSPFTGTNSPAHGISATPMFREINSFVATLNTFENSVGDQYNYGRSHSKLSRSYDCSINLNTVCQL